MPSGARFRPSGRQRPAHPAGRRHRSRPAAGARPILAPPCPSREATAGRLALPQAPGWDPPPPPFPLVAAGAPKPRQSKLPPWPGFFLPPPLVVKLASSPCRRPYYDTADLRLTRAGISVRHRSGGGENGWTVKLPEGSDGPALVRRELNFAGGPAAVPAEVAHLVRVHARTSPLVPVARLVTRRQRVELRDATQAVAEVDDDEVSVLDGRRVAARFREIEVELLGDADPGCSTRWSNGCAASVPARLTRCPRWCGRSAPGPWRRPRWSRRR